MPERKKKETRPAGAGRSAAGKAPGREKAVRSAKPADRTSPARKKSPKGTLPGGKTLVIVESPSKAKTLNKILGKDYDIQASVGHIRDLPKSRLAIDIENGFEPEYIVVRGKGDIARNLKNRAAVSGRVLIASDPDREGEAIAWHISGILGIDPASLCRVRMYEITPKGVKEAFESVSSVDMRKVDAQQARRVLDRLVGYKLSPLLWNKIRRGLSAGRVQSAALKMICDREREIESFEPREYWQVMVSARADDGRAYSLRVDRLDGKSLIKDGRTMLIGDRAGADEIEKEIRSNPISVSSFTQKEGIRKPLPPFKTSTLQQEAARRFAFTPRRTMSTAQGLYEGVNIPGRGPTGLITYMRTDSLRSAPEAVAAAREYVSASFDKRYLPPAAQVYEAKGRSQDAHEAIRPTDISLVPDSIKAHLSPDQYKLYDLIWRRFVSGQMSPARIARSTVEAESGRVGMRQSGASVIFDGWGAVWPLEMKEEILDPAVEGERLELMDILKEQKFTKPPARYTDSGLVKALEDEGIGRPSTYASIVQTLYDRRYVNRNDEKRLEPTPLGRIVDKFLEAHFPGIVDRAFTAGMESELDGIEEDGRQWRDVVQAFWGGFSAALSEAEAKAEKVPPPPPELIGEDCPLCGSPLVLKSGRFGDFIGCMAFPDPEKKCSFTRPILKSIGVICPKCAGGDVVRRRGKGGKPFYGCSRYPECDFVSWAQPTGEKCASCGGAIVTKGKGGDRVCASCGAAEAPTGEDES
ncbi:MAG: type I DNA topoisomerase [Thermovirgaceae bacterium]|nr:type I DNA topoisomerase [Thermovirgaceae bacterium]